MSQVNAQQLLQQTLNFIEADYQMNIDGKLTSNQLERLEKQEQKAIRGLRLIEVGSIVSCLFILIGGPAFYRDNPVLSWNYSFSNTTILITVGLILLIEYMFWKRRKRDPQTRNTVIPIHTFVHLEPATSGGYFIQTLRLRSSVSRELYQVLQPYNVYTLNYSPYYEGFVSAKWFGHIQFDEVHQQLETAIRQQRKLPLHVPPLVAEGWDFTGEDLEANRNGRLSGTQLATLLKGIAINLSNIPSPDSNTPVLQVRGIYQPPFDKWEPQLINKFTQANIRVVPVIKIGNIDISIRSTEKLMALLGLEKGVTYTAYYVVDKRTNSNKLVSIERV
jgi:hypothetical protein